VTYLDLVNTVKTAAFPARIPANKIPQFNIQLMAAVGDLQWEVPMLQVGQNITRDQGATFWKCGSTFIELPILQVVNRVSVVDEENECCQFKVTGVTASQMACLSRSCAELTPPEGAPNDDGYYVSDPTIDPEAGCLPSEYYVSLVDNRLQIYRPITSTRIVKVTYTGIKRSWANADVLPDSWVLSNIIDPEIVDYLRLSMQLKMGMCDATEITMVNREFQERRRRLMTDQARKEAYRMAIESPCVSCCR
jgi:hypothetical protein